ncbi:MAG: beta-lactamase family protein [Acidobacteria bacterium]|nr:beta-lactamase family protein [Acidobacteriota bacterium]MCL5288933.1 beta-lactamase family protein [Acidobacteriota bacterium]
MKLRFRSLRFSFFLAGLVVLVAGAFWAQPQSPVASAPPPTTLSEAIERSRALIKAQLAPKVPGLSVAVAANGKIVWSEGFGFADLEKQTPVTTATRFRIGSISKSVTAAGLALLVERGKLDLDAPVQKYVADFPDKGAVITTRLLAGHLAGIRHYKGDEFLLNRPFKCVREGLAIFENDPLVAPPGTKYSYSTYGWNLISAVMETAAKQEFLSFMEQKVFKKLKMKSTRPDRAGAADPQRTQFYDTDPQVKFAIAPTVDCSYKWAGGGFLSTPEDLVRFGSAHLQPGFLKKETLELLFTSQKTSDGKETGYGIGWSILKDASGHRILMHTGGSVGGTSVLLLHPDSKIVVAMICNHSRSPFAKDAREAIADFFAPLFAGNQ